MREWVIIIVEMIGKRIILGLFLLTCSALLFAQQSRQAGTIIYAQGEVFSISRQGDYREYDLYYDDVIGLTLRKGDYISTESGTFLEIQLSGSANVLKISENTSFTITKSSRETGSSINITYGRLRAKVGKLTGNEQFTIRNPSVVAGVRGTDFGYDVIVGKADDDPGSSLTSLTRVYCFEGKVEVNKVEKVTVEEPEKEEVPEAEPKPKEEERIIETVILEADQMAVQPTEEPEKPLQVTTVEEEVVDFWEENDFKGELIEPVVSKAEEELAEEAPPEEKPAEEKAEEPEEEVVQKEEEEKTEHKVFSRRDTLVAVGTGTLITGALIEGAGLALYFAGDTIFPRSDPSTTSSTGTALMIAGGVVISGALITFLTALFEE